MTNTPLDENQQNELNTSADNIIEDATNEAQPVNKDTSVQTANLLRRKKLRQALRRKLLIKQILYFAIIGGICFIVDYCTMLLLTELLGLSYLISNLISCVLSIICNYLLTMRFVFYRKHNLPRYTEIGIFALISVVGIAFNQLLMWLGTEYILKDYRLVKVISTIIVTIFNFVVKKIFVSAK